MCHENKGENYEAEVPIHWELNGLSQDDPKLIEEIRAKVLIEPDGKPLNLFRPSGKRLQGQYGQPAEVESVLKLDKKKKKKKKKTKTNKSKV